jgi:hypothetical protein
MHSANFFLWILFLLKIKKFQKISINIVSLMGRESLANLKVGNPSSPAIDFVW